MWTVVSGFIRACAIYFAIESTCIWNPSHVDMHIREYAAFHQHPINRFIHVLCVWPLLLTGLMMCEMSTPLRFSFCRASASFIVCMSYIVCYLRLDEQVGIHGLVSAMGIFCVYVLAYRFSRARIASFAQVASVHASYWVAQIIGHLVFEQNAPAFTTNAIHSFLMAPHFVLGECVREIHSVMTKGISGHGQQA